MTFRRKGLVLAMEDDSVLAVDPVESEEQIVPAEVEQEVADVKEEEAEVADLAEAIEEAVEDAETMADVQDVMQEQIDGEVNEQGETVSPGEGVDETTAEIAEIAVEAICSRLGIRGSVKMPSLESFASTNSRLTATRFAVESIGEKIKTAWEAIKKALAALWTKVKDFVSRAIASFTGLEKAAASAEAAVKGIAGKTAQKETFTNSNVGKAFTIGQGPVTADSVVSILANHVMTIQDLATDAPKFEKAIKEIAAVAENVGKDGASEEVKAKVSETIKQLGEAAKSKLFGGKAGDSYYQTEQLVNGKTLAMFIKDDGAESGFISINELDVKRTVSDEAKVGTEAELLKVVEHVKTLAAEVKDLKKNQDFIGRIESTTNSAIDKVIKKIGSMKDEAAAKAAAEDVKAARSAIAALGNSVGKLSFKVPGMATYAGKVALNYVAGSVAAYKETKAEKTPETK